MERPARRVGVDHPEDRGRELLAVLDDLLDRAGLHLAEQAFGIGEFLGLPPRAGERHEEKDHGNDGHDPEEHLRRTHAIPALAFGRLAFFAHGSSQVFRTSARIRSARRRTMSRRAASNPASARKVKRS